ncbi:MAG: hypothetical protein M0R80_23550 [Proteobacteria bacterium]|jgi:hypothetical protein|nr:hypothetical protein [Pseudomonadota bacterium]
MGYYVNPPNRSKEAFLAEKGIPAINPKWEDVPEGFLPVCLVDNGPFTAAGICYCEAELQCFSDPTDTRRRDFFMCTIEDLLRVSGDDFARWVGKKGLLKQ